MKDLEPEIQAGCAACAANLINITNLRTYVDCQIRSKPDKAKKNRQVEQKKTRGGALKRLPWSEGRKKLIICCRQPGRGAYEPIAPGLLLSRVQARAPWVGW